MRHALGIHDPRYCFVAAHVDVFDDEVAFEAALRGVSPWRRERALTYRFEKDRRLSLLAGLLLDELLAECGLREIDMSYVEGEHGKPSFENAPAYHFSLAHSETMAAAALAHDPVGVDVEHLPTFPYDIADPYEWTRMEAVGKALGTGVGVFVDSGCFTVPEGFRIEHRECGDYLVCVALQCQKH